MSTRRSIPLTPVCLALALALTIGGVQAAAGPCYTATVTDPVLLPDGEVRAGGELRICRFKQLTPSTTLHSLSIDGVAYGLFMGVRQPVEAGATETAAFVFATSGVQAMRLQAVAYPERGELHAYRADLIGRGRVTTHDTVRLADAGAETLVVPALAR